MADPYTQASLNPMDPAALQAATEAFRRQEAMATLAEISGDPVLGRVGAGMRERVSERRKGLAKAREAAKKRAEWRPTGMPGFGIKDGKVQMYPGYDEFLEQKHQRGLELARERSKYRGGGFDEWVTKQMMLREMPTASQAAEARKTEAYLPEIQNLARGLQKPEVEIDPLAEAGGEFAREYLPLGSAAAAGIERRGMSPEAMRWLERGRQAESDIIRLASGLAVTGFELENVKKWSPWTGNLTKQQRTDRMRNIYNKLGRESRAIMNQPYEDISPEGFLGQPAAPPTAAPARPEGITDEEWQQYLALEGYTPS